MKKIGCQNHQNYKGDREREYNCDENKLNRASKEIEQNLFSIIGQVDIKDPKVN